MQAGKEMIAKIMAGGAITFSQEEDSQLSKYTSNDKNYNYLVNKLKKRQNQKKYKKLQINN
jgi:hypothetical protein